MGKEKKMRTVIFLAGLLLALPAFPDTPQQEKMKACNADAAKKELAGDDRKAFMKDCLSARAEAATSDAKPMTAQQKKMKQCNADAKAKDLKGDARKGFMSNCLKDK